MFDAIRKGIGWGGVVSSGLGAWAVALNIPPVYDVLSQNSILMRGIVEYRNVWLPVTRKLQDMVEFQVLQPTADLISVFFLFLFACIFKGDGWSRIVALAIMVYAPFAVWRDVGTVNSDALLSEQTFSILYLLVLMLFIVPIPAIILGRSENSSRMLETSVGLVFQILGAMLVIAGLTFGLEYIL